MNQNTIKSDIAVIGGGASGICSAISAKSSDRNLNVIILEKLLRTGTKILASGNGRCNLGNKNLSPEFYHSSISNFMDIISENDTEEFFNSLGLVCRTDSEGRIYPYSNKSSSVLDALRISLKNLDIPEICGFDVKSIEKSGNNFIIKSNDRTVYARRIIISSGGYSTPVMGTDGAITEIIKKSHRVTEVYPSLVSLPYKNPKEYKSLAGIRARGTVMAFSDGKKLDSETGEIQFSENTLSGICVFNLSYLRPQKIKIDFMPEKSFHEVSDLLFYIKNIRRDCMLDEYLTGIVAKNLGIYMIKKAVHQDQKPKSDFSMIKKVSSLSASEIKCIAGMIKSMEIDVMPPVSWKNSQVTAGGIYGSEVDENLQSKRCKGMYFSGEILDIDGKCGGYNLEWAWASGLWAGKKCAEGMVKKHDKTE